MTAASVILAAARNELNDPSGPDERWSDGDLLGYLTIAQRELVKIKPEANAQPDTFMFGNTAARQRLDPASYYAVLRVDANAVGEGNWGEAIRTVERDVLDTFYAAWPVSSNAPGTEGTRYKVAAMDSSDPLAFWIFPQPVVDDVLHITSVPIPVELTDPAGPIELNDIHIPALTLFVCHLAMRSEERAQSESNSMRYFEGFNALLGLGRKTARTVGVDQPRPPEAKQ